MTDGTNPLLPLLVLLLIAVIYSSGTGQELPLVLYCLVKQGQEAPLPVVVAVGGYWITTYCYFIYTSHPL